MESVKSTFIEHLEELRKRIIICLITIIIAALACYPLAGKLLPLLARPVGRLVFIQPLEAFVTYLKVTLICGFCLALPVILYQIWAFVVNGLRPAERRYLLYFIPLSFALFVLGAGFAYTVIVPCGLRFLLSFGGDYLQPMISVSRYISFLGMMLLAFGLAFELPVVILFLVKLGLVSPGLLARNRKYVLLVIFILAAVLTPPDIFTQIMMALPLLFLYEVSILLARLLGRKE